jgi:hypothetical protein
MAVIELMYLKARCYEMDLEAQGLAGKQNEEGNEKGRNKQKGMLKVKG